MHVRVGIVGAGAIAREHASALALLGCELVSVMGPNRDRADQFAKDFQASRATTDVEQVLDAPDIDAIVIASPNAMHAEQAAAAIIRGKHVLCEIPLGLSLDEVQLVEAASRGHPSLVCMVCHTQRYMAPIAELAERTRAGSFSPISLAQVTALPRRINVGWTGRQRSWTDNILWHHGVHALDTALFLLHDQADVVEAMAGPMRTDTGLPMDLAMVIRTLGGRLATLALSYNAETPIHQLLVTGPNETWRFGEWQNSGALGGSVTPVTSNGLGAAVEAQDGAFVQNVRLEQRDGPVLSEVLPTYRVAQLVQELVNGTNYHGPTRSTAI